MNGEFVPGDSLDGRYVIEGVLGEGGFAVVYRARERASGRQVAVKVLSRELLDSERTRARFEREIEVVANLQSPHTVKLFGRGITSAGAPYIVFERVPGRDLREVLTEHQRLPPRIVRHVLRQVLMALAEAHRAGIIHRDLKPANIRVFEYDGDPWRAKVLDFGVALATKDEGPRITAVNELVGTPRYMSPEQLLGEVPGAASDIYALGIVAWEMLVGPRALHGPRWGDQLQRLQSGFHIVEDDDGDDYGGLATVVHRMTARDLTQRYSSAEAVLGALAEPTTTLVPPPAVTQPHAHPKQDETARAPDHETARAPDHRWLVIGGLATLAAVVAIAAMVLARGTAPDVDAPSVPKMPAVTHVASPTPSIIAQPTTADLGRLPSADVGFSPDLAQTSGASPGCGRKPRTTGRQWTPSLQPTRRRLVYLPTGYDPEQAHPIVVLVQTLFLAPEMMWAASQIEALADREGLIVVMFDRQNRLEAWLPEDAEFVFREIGEMASEYCVDPQRIFVIGHGAGTGFARELGCRANLAGLALVGDVERPTPRCASDPLPTIRFAGLKDRYAPVAGGRGCVGLNVVRPLTEIEKLWRETNDCHPKRRRWGPRDGGQCWTFDCAGAPFVSCHLDGGHNFPNHPEVFEALACGSDVPNTFPVTETIWKFFEEVEAVR